MCDEQRDKQNWDTTTVTHSLISIDTLQIKYDIWKLSIKEIVEIFHTI